MPWSALFALCVVRRVLGINSNTLIDAQIGVCAVMRLIRAGQNTHYVRSHANTLLGWCYCHGLFVSQSKDLAIQLWTQAAEQGNARAAKWLADLLDRQFEPERKWLPILRQAAAQGHPPAQNALAVHLEDDNPREAQEWFRKSASQGYCIAVANLANEIDNAAERLKTKLSMVNSGHPTTAFDLGEMYEQGVGTKQDIKAAYRLYRSVVDLLSNSTTDHSAESALGQNVTTNSLCCTRLATRSLRSNAQRPKQSSIFALQRIWGLTTRFTNCTAWGDTLALIRTTTCVKRTVLISMTRKMNPSELHAKIAMWLSW